MIFRETTLAGAYVIDPERHPDDRGYFARTWCREAFAARGLRTAWDQCSTSFNHRRGTLRGMHYQAAPHAEAKLVRCTRGAVYDVLLDLRAGSPTWGRWVAVELTAESGRAVYIPEGVAHGFQTLADASEVFYQISVPFVPTAARGVLWNDPVFGIEWPLPDPIMSDRDAGFPHRDGDW